jgi:hypothetical protein
MAAEEARYCENSLMLYGQREKSWGSFDFALEDLGLDKACGAALRMTEINILYELKFKVL